MQFSFPIRVLAALMIVSGFAYPLAAQDDLKAAKDHPLIGRYAGSEIFGYKLSEFDEQRFLNAPIDLKVDGEKLTETNSVKVEGRITDIRYNAPKDRSLLEIMKNYEDSLKSKGFEILYSCADETCFKGNTSVYRFNFVGGDGTIDYRYGDGVRYLLAKATKPAGDVYAAVILGESKTGPLVHVIAADVQAMQGDQIAFVDAGAMEQSIAASGHVALYGIQFDFDKADIKAESRPTLDEIAKFLKANGDISVVVAGHTDSKGSFEYNIDLSGQRADAVVADLVKHYGISPKRLTPFGAGMSSPLATNDDEAGRTKNRRVELVKR